MAHRRHVLALLGGGAALAAAGAGAFVWNENRLAQIAVAAWRAPGAGEADPRRHALAHAILAPNPHNMQPWLVALEGADTIVFSADLSRLLPATDPPNRQIVMGCGGFLELLALAAAANGHRAEIDLWPEGEPQPVLDARPIARIRLVPDAAIAKAPLFDAILERRTNREPFDPARIPAAADLEAVAAAAAAPGLTLGWATADGEVAALRDLVWRGWVREFETPAAAAESAHVMRVGKGEIAKHRDGISLDFPFAGVLKALGQLTPEKLADPASPAAQEGVKIWRPLAETAPAFIWLRSAGNSRATQIAAGRAYARLNLAAAARGLALHPWSMSLQEYPAMADLYAETQARFGADAQNPVQMLCRIGYAKSVPPAPRRGLEAHLTA